MINYTNISKVMYNYMSRCKCTGEIQGVGLGWWGDISFSLKNISSWYLLPKSKYLNKFHANVLLHETSSLFSSKDKINKEKKVSSASIFV